MKAHAKRVRCGGAIIEKNGKHTHIRDKDTAEAIKRLINSQSKPNEEYIKYLSVKGIHTTQEEIIKGLDRAEEKHLIKNWRKWKEWKPQKQKYYNVGKKARRII